MKRTTLWMMAALLAAAMPLGAQMRGAAGPRGRCAGYNAGNCPCRGGGGPRGSGRMMGPQRTGQCPRMNRAPYTPPPAPAAPDPAR